MEGDNVIFLRKIRRKRNITSINNRRKQQSCVFSFDVAVMIKIISSR